jgi:hypothetical protein
MNNIMNFKQFMHQQQLNEGRNITLPPEVLSAIDQYLPEIMLQTCQSKSTGKRFEMDLIEFNNKYIKKDYKRNVELNNIFDWDQMLKDPVMQEVKRQIDQQLQQQKNQLIKIVIDPKETKEMSHAAGWAKSRQTDKQTNISELKQNINKIIDENYQNLTTIFDEYYSQSHISSRLKMGYDRNHNEPETNALMTGIKYYFHEEIQKTKLISIVNLNENLCTIPVDAFRETIIHETIHCIDPKLIYRDKIKDPNYYVLKRGDKGVNFKKYKSNKIEIEANVGVMVQQIFDLVNNSTNYQKTKSKIESLARQLKNAPKPSSFGFFHWLVHWIEKHFRQDVIFGTILSYLDPDNLERNQNFAMYTRELTPEIRRKVLERLSNAVLQAKEMLETKYKSK